MIVVGIFAALSLLAFAFAWRLYSRGARMRRRRVSAAELRAHIAEHAAMARPVLDCDDEHVRHLRAHGALLEPEDRS